MGELLRLAFLASLIVLFGLGSLSAAEKASKKAAKEPVEAKAAEPAPEAPGGPPVQLADIWVLDFRFQKVGIIQPTDGLFRGQPYWYLLYQIENKTGQDREAYISITASSNRSKTYSSILQPDIETLIERRVGKPLWGKTEEADALKARKDEIKSEKAAFHYFPFKAGKTLDCVAVFNKLDPGATSITVNVEGLSNDIHAIEGQAKIESRLFVVELERPGDEYAMNLDSFRLNRSYWAKKQTDLQLPKDAKDTKDKKAAPEDAGQKEAPEESEK